LTHRGNSLILFSRPIGHSRYVVELNDNNIIKYHTTYIEVAQNIETIAKLLNLFAMWVTGIVTIIALCYLLCLLPRCDYTDCIMNC